MKTTKYLFHENFLYKMPPKSPKCRILRFSDFFEDFFSVKISCHTDFFP